MKIFSLILLKMLLFLGFIFLFNEKNYSQVNQDSLNQSFKEWRHMEKYNRIIQQSIFTSTMSDDEMAGIELWRAGRNLKMSFSFMIVGIGIGSTASWLPQRLFGTNYKGKLTPEDVQIAILVVSSGFLIASICELVCGYNKIGKAGIIIQHKKFNIKTNGNNISFNF